MSNTQRNGVDMAWSLIQLGPHSFEAVTGPDLDYGTEIEVVPRSELEEITASLQAESDANFAEVERLQHQLDWIAEHGTDGSYAREAVAQSRKRRGMTLSADSASAPGLEGAAVKLTAGRRAPEVNVSLETALLRLRPHRIYAADVAQTCRISPATFSGIRTGRYVPSPVIAQRISAVLHVPVAELWPDLGSDAR